VPRAAGLALIGASSTLMCGLLNNLQAAFCAAMAVRASQCGCCTQQALHSSCDSVYVCWPRMRMQLHKRGGGLMLIAMPWAVEACWQCRSVLVLAAREAARPKCTRLRAKLSVPLRSCGT
jgi:hypothetical protein